MALDQSRSNVQKARQALNKVLTAEEWLNVCRACSLDTTEEQQRCEEMKRFLEPYLTAFGGLHPTQ